jgi:hypothetical protein
MQHQLAALQAFLTWQLQQREHTTAGCLNALMVGCILVLKLATLSLSVLPAPADIKQKTPKDFDLTGEGQRHHTRTTCASQWVDTA